MLPRFLLEAGADAVVVGEGELTFERLLDNGIVLGAAGLTCLEGNKLITGPPQCLIVPLDQLQPPARDLMPQPHDAIHLMETSRGCPHDCAFCETTRFYGRRWRPYSPERVVSEVRRLVGDFDAWIIHITDDNFAADRKRVLHICSELQKETLPAFFMVSARADDLVTDPELLPAMAAARILRITVGVETLVPEIASSIRKPTGLDVYREAFKRMREFHIFSIASFIVGLPGERPQERENAVDLALEAGPDSARFLPFLPLPGILLTSKRDGFDPYPCDVIDAQRFNCEFLYHPTVQANLKTAAEKRNIRGMLARATLKKSKKPLVSQVHGKLSTPA
jgi:anaerobic magnesium-protoporphyrin IX monomethyl ester cyclase